MEALAQWLEILGRRRAILVVLAVVFGLMIAANVWPVRAENLTDDIPFATEFDLAEHTGLGFSFRYLRIFDESIGGKGSYFVDLVALATDLIFWALVIGLIAGFLWKAGKLGGKLTKS